MAFEYDWVSVPSLFFLELIANCRTMFWGKAA